MSKKKLLVVTGGGDCPGLNAVIRAIVKRANVSDEWDVYGSEKSFQGVFSDPPRLIKLDLPKVRGIHVQGGTIIQTTNKGNPLKWFDADDRKTKDRGDELVDLIKKLGFDAVISIGGDGSQTIANELFKRGCPIVGVPKTIDNDLSGTDFTFGFHTAVQIATESIDRLVTTAESHNRVMIVEVMGRDAGWIALHSAIAGGAEVCLVPEIEYDIERVSERIKGRFKDGKGFAIVVIAEGAKPNGKRVFQNSQSKSESENLRLGGVAYKLSEQLKSQDLDCEIREVVLGHLLRGGTPVAFDRILSSQFGVKAFEMIENGEFGRLVSYRCPDITSVELKDAVSVYKTIKLDDPLVQTARGLNICLGD